MSSNEFLFIRGEEYSLMIGCVIIMAIKHEVKRICLWVKSV